MEEHWCIHCRGDGDLSCRNCQGMGYTMGGMGRLCGACDGQGSYTCPLCSGTGRISIQKDQCGDIQILKANQDIEGLLKGLSYQKEGDQFSYFVREAAAVALGEIGNVQTVMPLIAALKDENWVVREAAIVALGEIGDKRAVEPLITFLKDEDAETRLKAIKSLGKIGDAQAVLPLITAFKDENPDVRSEIASILVKMGPPAVEPLITAGSWDEKHKGSFESILAEIGTPAVKPLIACLAFEKEKYSAVRVLVEIGEPAVKPLIAVLKKHKPSGRQLAINTLGEIGDRRAVKQLLDALADEKMDVRMAAVVSLGKIGDRRAVKQLLDALADTETEVRMAAVMSLGEIGDPQAVEPLLEILAAKTSLIHKTEKKAGESTPFLENEEHNNIAYCEKTIEALGKIRDPRAVEPLINALTDEMTEHTYIHEKAAQALAEIGDPRVVMPLIAALNDKSYGARAIAADALGKIGDARAVETLTAIVEAGPNAYRMKQSAARKSSSYAPNQFDGFVDFRIYPLALRVYQSAEKALEQIYARTGSPRPNH